MDSDERYVWTRPLRHSLLGLCTGLLAAGAGCSPATEQAPGDLTASVQAAATVSPEVIVAAPVQQPVIGRWPAAAFSGTQYLAVWEDFRTGRPILYGARIAADGTALDGAGIALLDALPDAGTFRVFDAAVASDGEGFLVVTEAGEQILGVRVGQDGEVLDPGGFVIATPGPFRSRPALVFDGEQYLVAWARWSTGARDEGHVYWARVTPAGTVLDPEGVRGFALQNTSQVAVSFDGTNHLLSWVTLDSATQRRRVFAARIRVDGTAIDTAGFPVTPGDMGVSGGSGPASAFDGTNHVIVWQSSVPHPDEDLDNFRVVRVTRVTPQGAVLDAAGLEVHREYPESVNLHRLAITAAGGRSIALIGRDYDGEGGPTSADFQIAEISATGSVTEHPAHERFYGLEPTVVAHPAGALLLWRAGDSLYRNSTQIIGARLGVTGQPVAGNLVAPASSTSRQEVRGMVSDGRTFFVVWSDTRDPYADEALRASRIEADGTLLDPEGIQLTTTGAGFVAPLFDGTNFVVVWDYDNDGGRSKFVRVRPDGEVLGTEEPEEPFLYETLTGTSNGTHALLVGRDFHEGDIVLAAALVDRLGAPAGELVPIDVVERRNIREVAVSFDGTGYLVIWFDDDDNELLGQVLSADGALVGGQFHIVSGQELRRATTHFGGGNHLVVWQGDDGLFATRVTPNGQVLDPEGRLIAAVDPMCNSPAYCCERGGPIPTGTCHSVAFDGSNFLVAWQAPGVPGDTRTMNVYGAEISPDGEVLDSFTVSSEPGPEGAPFLAATAYGHVLAAFRRFVPDAPYDAQQVRARFLTEGSPIPDPPDAGPIGPDAGPPGPTPDAGGSPAEPLPGDGDGCGCSAGAAQPTPAAPLLLLGGVIGLWLVRRRRGAARPG